MSPILKVMQSVELHDSRPIFTLILHLKIYENFVKSNASYIHHNNSQIQQQNITFLHFYRRYDDILSL